MSAGKLPEGWVETNLQNVASWGSGGTPSRNHDEYYNGNIPWIKTGDLGPKIITNASEYITDAGVQNSSAKFFPKGSVAIAMYGATIGKTSILGIDATTNQACAVGTPLEGITSTLFLYYFLLNEKNAFIKKGKGGAQPNISQTVIKEHIIYLPPLAEQKIITEKLDTLLAQVDSTKARLEQIPQILKRFRQAVLRTAMSGNLTGEWRLSNHSIILAEEIEETKNRLIEKKLVKKDLTYASLDKRYPLPPSWLYINLQSVSTKITDGEHKTPKRETAGKFLLSARNIQDGYIKLADVDYVGDAEFQKLRNRCDPDYGDILISCSGSIGRVCLVDENSKYVMVRSVALVKLMQDFVINKYMMFLLQSPLLQKEIEENSKSTAQSNLFLGPIKNLGIPLPPVSEQAEIVRRVEQLFAYADTIEKQVNNALARVNNLTQSILAKAFRGELTAQWRAENPDLISGENSAAALLEKIKAERAASGGKKASRKKS
ncbi:TPA: restriction endonuclease subunit S [Escherichia coli]